MRIVRLLCALAALAPTLPAQTTVPSTPPQIVTTGSGEAQVSPDRATVYVAVQTRATTAAAAASDNARRLSAVLDTLRAIGISGDAVSTQNFSVQPEMRSGPNETPRVIAYVVNNTVRASLRRVEDVGRVIDASLAKGANQIAGLDFYSSKADSVRRVALALAVANARSDADALARAAGGSLGSLLELSSNGPYVRPMQRALAGGMVASMSTPIEPGQQTVQASVSARWAFVAGR